MSTWMSLSNSSAKLSLICCLILSLSFKIAHLHILPAAANSQKIINSIQIPSIQNSGLEVKQREQGRQSITASEYKNEIEFDCVGRPLLLYELNVGYNSTDFTNSIVKQMAAFSNASCILVTFSNLRHSSMKNFGEEKKTISEIQEAVEVEKEGCENESEDEDNEQKMFETLLNEVKNPAIFIRVVRVHNTSKIAATVNDRIPMQDFDPVNHTIFADFSSPIINQLIVLAQCIATTEVDQLTTINSKIILQLYFLHYSGPCSRGYGDLKKLKEELEFNCRGKLVTVYETHKCNLHKPYNEMIVERLNQISLHRGEKNQDNCALIVYTDPVIPFIQTFGNKSNSRTEKIKRQIRARECKTKGSSEGSLAKVWTTFLDGLKIPALFFTFTNNGNTTNISPNKKFGMDEFTNGNNSVDVQLHDVIIEEMMNLGNCIAKAGEDNERFPRKSCKDQRYSLGVQTFCTRKVLLIYTKDECQITRTYAEAIIKNVLKYPENCFLVVFQNSELPSIRNFGFNSKSTDKIQKIINSATQSRCKITIGVENENADENLEFLDSLNIPAIYFALVASNEVVMIPNNKIVNDSNNQGRIIKVSLNDKIITDTIIFSNTTARRSNVSDLASTELIEGNLLLRLPKGDFDASSVNIVNYFSIGSFSVVIIVFLALAMVIFYSGRSPPDDNVGNNSDQEKIPLQNLVPDHPSGLDGAESETNSDTSDDSSEEYDGLSVSGNISTNEDSKGLRRRKKEKQIVQEKIESKKDTKQLDLDKHMHADVHEKMTAAIAKRIDTTTQMMDIESRIAPEEMKILLNLKAELKNTEMKIWLDVAKMRRDVVEELAALRRKMMQELLPTDDKKGRRRVEKKLRDIEHKMRTDGNAKILQDISDMVEKICTLQEKIKLPKK